MILKASVLFVLIVSGSCQAASMPPPLAPLLDVDPSAIIANRYIVKLRDDVQFTSHRDDILSTLLQKHPTASVQREYTGDGFIGYALEAPDPSAVRELRAFSDVEYVEPDQVCEAAWTQFNAPWNLARISQRKLTTSSYIYNTKAGAGVLIYILDTGVHLTHRDFNGRASLGASFNGEKGDNDGNGHGTHVAGTAAGRTYGVAKAATIISVPVLSSDGRGSWSNMIAAVQWTVEDCRRRKGNDLKCVINMSIGGPKSTSVNTAIDNAVRAGLHVVVAAGNDATDACNKSPASAPLATTVGSVNSKDRLSSFSNFGVCVDIHAPGEGIQSSWPSSDTAYAYLGGTSMASPHVAGVKALFLAYNYVKPAVLGDALRRLATANVIQGLPANTNNNFIVFNAPPKAKFDAALSGKAGREEEVTEETDLSVARIFDGFGDDDLVDSLDDDVIDSNAVARLQLQTA